LFIFIEFDIKSFYLVVYCLPFISVFTVGNFVGLDFVHLILTVYCSTVLVKYLVDIRKQNKKFDYKIIISFLIMAIYIAIPFREKFSIVSVFESFVWLAVFFIFVVYRETLNIKHLFYCFVCGIFVSAGLSLFIPVIPYLKKTIEVYYIGNLQRYSAIMTNPNLFYELCLSAIVLLFVLILNNKISVYYGFLTILLSVLGILTISKTFLICMILIMFILILALVVKRNKKCLVTVAVFAVSVVISAVIVLPYTNELIGRGKSITNIESSESYDEKTEEGDVLDSKEEQGASEAGFTGRFDIWKMYVNDLIDSGYDTLFGQGVGSAHGLAGTHPHNSYIQMVYEMGLVGVVLIIAFCLYLMIILNFSIRKAWINLTYSPLLVMLFYFLVESHFMSMIGNVIIILSASCFLIKGDENGKQNS